MAKSSIFMTSTVQSVSLLLSLVVWSSGSFAQTPAQGAVRLTSGQRIEKEIKSGETHHYSVPLKQGEAIRVDLIEKGVNVGVAIKDSGQKEVFELNTGEGLDHEKFTFIVAQAGDYTVNVKAATGKDGKYELNVNFGAATEFDAKNVAALKLENEGVTSFKKGTAEGVMQTIANWEKSVNLYAETGDDFKHAEMLGNIGVLYSMLGQKVKAVELQEKTIPVLTKLGEKRKVALALTNIGTVYATLGVAPKAIPYFERALPIFQEMGDKNSEVALTSNVGTLYGNIGEYAKSLESYFKALKLIETLDAKTQPVYLSKVYASLGSNYTQIGEIGKAADYLQRAVDAAKQTGDLRTQAAILNNLALIKSQTGAYREALEMYREVEASAKALGDKSLGILALISSAYAYNLLGESQKALEFLELSLKLSRTIGDKRTEAVSLSSMGSIYVDLGEIKKGLEYLNEALIIEKAAKLKELQAETLQNIGHAYNRLDELDKAIEVFNTALLIAEEIGNKGLQAVIFNNLSDTYSDKREYEKSLQYARKAEQVSKAIGKRDVQATALNNISVAYALLGDTTSAIETYAESLMLLRQTGLKKGEALTQGNLMQTWYLRGNWPVAIFYGKQAINNYQLLRSNIGGLEQETQRSFVKTIEGDYRRLAEILTEAGRFSEAEKVLSLLKEEEYFDYVRRDAGEIANLKARIDVKPDEQKMIDRYSALADNLTAVGLEFQKLDDRKRKLAAGASLTPEDQTRYDELTNQLNDANKVFRLFLDTELLAELGKIKRKEIDDDRSLQGKLRQWGDGTVTIYTIAGEERYRAILTTPSVQKDGKSEIKASDLNKKIFAFRAALQNPTVDPRPLGKELYDMLIKPLEKDLAGAKAKTILWSLDGTLRYVPIAALWDGEQYLAQKYRNVVITSTTRKGLLEKPEKDWQALGLGVSTEQTVSDPILPDEKIIFSALPGVKEELDTIVRDEQTPSESGHITGKRFLDEKFNAENFAGFLSKETGDGKRKYTVVHIASHFRLGGNAANSFLLLGDGKTLTLEQVADSPQMTFDGVELVTLSACNTAFGSGNSTGKEVDSLATFIELRGAKSVLATLWSVADESTQLLMSEFYRLHKQNPNITKAEAMQRVQKAMIEGRPKSSNKSSGCRSEKVNINGSKTAVFKCDANAPFSHPYYWSPFILIGNWR